MAVTVFPVPRGYTLQQAWDEIETFGEFIEYRWWKPRYRWPLLRWGVCVDER